MNLSIEDAKIVGKDIVLTCDEETGPHIGRTHIITFSLNKYFELRKQLAQVRFDKDGNPIRDTTLH